MKHKKTVKEFHYARDIEEVLGELDDIGLQKHSNFLERVCNRYPLLSKVEVAMIVKSTFEVMRELLIKGCIININRFFFDFKLHFFKHSRSKEQGAALKAKIGTPPIFKERPSFKPYETKNDRIRKARKSG